jgi:hypothetical protein
MLRPGLLETCWRRRTPNGSTLRCDIYLTEVGLETRLRLGDEVVASQHCVEIDAARASAELFRHGVIDHLPLQDATGQHWFKSHANGWMSEVWRGPDAYFYYRAFHADAIPEDYRNAARSLSGARRRADAAVPAHTCDCPDWQEWRWTVHAFPSPTRAGNDLAD